MTCTDCSNYNLGHGNKSCLKCKQYVEILKSSVKRVTIKIESIPDILLENIPDNQETTIYDLLRQLPIEQSTPLLMYYLLDASQREIANYLDITQMDVSRKINIAIDFIKKNTLKE
jgi:DNA-directed RNA polymerase specialized sigma subunit